MREYDDELDLTDYDFKNDGFVGASFNDDDNKRKLAYRHRIIAQKYKEVLFTLLNLIFEGILLFLFLQNNLISGFSLCLILVFMAIKKLSFLYVTTLYFNRSNQV